MLLANYPESIW